MGETAIAIGEKEGTAGDRSRGDFWSVTVKMHYAGGIVTGALLVRGNPTMT